MFSAAALSHEHCSADCLPHEQVACAWHTHSEARPQQVEGLTIVTVCER